MNSTITNYNKKSRNAIKHLQLDLSIYSNIFTNSPRIKENIEKYKDLIYTFEELSQDIYLALFKSNLVIKHITEVSPAFSLNYWIIKGLIDTDDFQNLRYSCSLKHYDSILVTDILGQNIGDKFQELYKNDHEFRDRLLEYNKLIEEYKYHEQALEDLNELYSQSWTQIQRLLKTIEDKIEVSLDKVTEVLLRENTIFKSISEATKEVKDITSTLISWGLNDSILTPTSYEEKLEISLKLRSFKKVREIAEMAGRFKASASQLQKKKTKEEGQEICGVQLDNHIHKTLPSERLLLANDITKKGFYKKYTQKELLSYKYKNNKIKSKGPIICCIDTSASMKGDLEVWSKSVAISLLDISRKQGREFVAILFSNKVYKIIEFNQLRIEPKKLYELATFFYGSGTNFVEPLKESIRLINSTKYKYSDIVFITDGEALLDEEFIEQFKSIKEKKHFRMITVNVSDKIEDVLNTINDTQILIGKLTEEEVEEANNTLCTI